MRGGTGDRRRLVNEEELAERLAKHGFVTVRLAGATADELIRTVRGAAILVSVEGSNLAHGLYLLRHGGSMVILNPPYRVHTTVGDIGVFCGLRSGMFICEPDGESRTDFRADPDEVLRFIDALENRSQVDVRAIARSSMPISTLCYQPELTTVEKPRLFLSRIALFRVRWHP